MTFEQFQELEKKFDVQSIRVKGISIWPILRIYIASQIVFDHDRSVKVNASTVKSSLRYVFYGVRELFKKTDFLFLTSSDQRKKLGNKYIERADILSEISPNTLIVELPSNGKHSPKSDCPGASRIMSKIPFYGIVMLLSKLNSGINLEGEDVLKNILKESGIEIPYKKRLQIFLAERSLMKFLIRWKKLKTLYLTTPYTNMGYVFAFKERNLPVIEFQHGTISASHYAYNLNVECDRRLLPDKLLTFGRREAEVFGPNNYYIKKENVFPVGSFVIDHIMQEKPSSRLFQERTKGFDKIVAYTAQDALEDQFIPFLKKAAELKSDIAYVLIPRFKDKKYYDSYGFPSNVIYIPELTTYELMYMCDVHATINSTTALEAPSLGTLNVLANVENRARSYFEGFIDNKVCSYAESPEEFVEMISTLKSESKEQIASWNRQLFEPNFKDNLIEILNAKSK